MKNKLKALVAGTLGVCAMAMVGVAKVNAASIEFYNANNDTADKVYDKNVELEIGDTSVLTLTSYATNATVSTSAALGIYTQGLHYNANSSSTKCFKITNKTDSTLKVTVEVAARDSSSFKSATAYFGTNTVTTSTSDVTEISTTINASEIANLYADSRRIVIYSIKYESGVSTHNVTIKDVKDNVILETAVEDGTCLDYTPAISSVDSVFDGYYTDSSCSTKFDVSTTITEDLVLYANFTSDTNYVVNNMYSLDNTITKYMYNKFGANVTISNDLEVTNTIYTVLNGCKMQTSSNIECIGTNGAASTTKQSVKIDIPSSGTITTLMTVTGDSARNAQLLDSTGANVTVTKGDSAWDGTAASAYEQRTLTYAVEAGTYYLGGDNGMRVFSVEFTPYISNDVTATFEAQYNAATDADSTKLRFIGTIEGIAYEDYANISSIQFTFTFNEVDRICKVNKLYKAIENNGAAFKSAADNTMYVVYSLNNINKEAYKGLSLTNLKLTLTFSDGSTKTVAHDDIVLPEFTTTIA